MSEIIQNWLSSKLGIILDFNLLSFGAIAKDGHLIAQLLYNYGILNEDDLTKIHKTDNFEYALENLLYLHNFFKSLGIDSSLKKLEAIAQGDGMMALRLFYQLYLILNNKDKLYYITNKIIKDKGETANRSCVPPCTPDSQSEITQKSEKTTETSKPDLSSSAAVYKWHRNNYIEQYMRCNEIRQRYLLQFENIIKSRHVTIMENKKATKIRDYKVDPVFDSETNLMLNLQNELNKFDIPDFRCEPNMGQAKEFISNLKKKSEKFIKEKKLQKFMHKIFLHNLLETLLENQKAEFIDSVSKKILAQSYYEKQMETKLLEVRKQRDVMMYNKKLENDYLMKKKDEKFIAELYQQRHNVTLANLRNENERKRILELHRKLYNEKLRRRHKKHLNIAKGIVKDLFNLVIITLDYKEKYDNDVPDYLWYDWMSLFVTEQEILPLSEKPEEILMETEEQDLFTAEIYRQNRLDEKDMNDYLSLEWPWNLEELTDLYINSCDLIKAEENILGFSVHKCLRSKYPPSPPNNPPVLPKIKTAASIVGCSDENLAGVLETILKKKHILIINIQSAINYCLKAYAKENPEEPPEFVPEKEEIKKGAKPKKGQKNILKDKTETVVPLGQEVKETQTPKLFPGEEMDLSSQAQLGAYVHETLKLGLPLNDILIANIFVEYLKSLKHLKGWVLMNYPTNENAAITLESALQGIPIVYQNESEEMEFMGEEFNIYDYLREELFTEPIDRFKEKRLSKFLPYITQYKTPTKQKSYLNSFIYLTERTNVSLPELDQADHMQHFQILRNFYETLGCDNSMHYISLDPDTIRDIILAITKDSVFAADMYDDIIKIVLEIVEENKRKREEAARKISEDDAGAKKKGGKDKKGDKNKKGAKEKGGKEKRDSKKSKHDLIKKEKSKDEIKSRVASEPLEVEEPPKPGDLKWHFIDLPQPPEILTNLASFWEEVEEIYLNDFKQLFFLLRSCRNALIPYVKRIYSHMINYIERPDKKQEYVHQFQVIYNELENDLREDDEYKLEMHCKINEFKSKLWDVCVTKMRDSESERIRIINENWFYEQACMLITIFNAALQLELDRSASTYFFLQDYYYSTTPTGLIDAKYNKTTVKKYEINDNDSNYLVSSYSDIEATIEDNPLVTVLNNSLQESLNATNSWYSQATSSCKKIESLAAPKVKPDKKGKQALLDKPVVLSDLEKSVDSMLQEYQCAVDGENLRVKFRLNLINAKARHDLYELLYYGENMFHELYSKLDTRYHEEQESVRKLCEVFSKAVEASDGIQPRLILDGAKFYVDDKELLYEEPLEIPAPFKEEIDERKRLSHFTITQLSKLADIFFNLTVHDSIPTKSFIYIIEDMVAHVSENNEDNLLPSYWQLLPPEKVEDIIKTMFGNVEYVSWKDFIIFNLEIPFPTENELQMTRHQFRELDPDKLEFVNKTQFNMVEFWFDNDTYRRKLIKNLLAKLFKISDDRIHYALMLLSFCKDKDPVIGLAKAFGLAMGKLICWDEEIGKNYVQLLSYQKYLKEQEKLQTQQIAEDLYADLIKTVIPSTPSSSMSHEQTISLEGAEGTYILDEALPEEEEINIPFSPELCYTLPFNVILSIMTASLPWHYRVQCVKDNMLKETLEIMYESLRNDEFNCVFSHEFLNSTLLKNYLNDNLKFTACSPADLIETEIETCICTRDYNNSLSIDDAVSVEI